MKYFKLTIIILFFFLHVIITQNYIKVILFICIILFSIINNISLINIILFYFPLNRFINHYSNEIFDKWYFIIIIIYYIQSFIIKIKNKNLNIKIDKIKLIYLLFIVIILINGNLLLILNALNKTNYYYRIAEYIIYFPLLFIDDERDGENQTFIYLTVISVFIGNILGLYELINKKYIIIANDTQTYNISDYITYYSRFNPSIGLPTLDWGILCGITILIIYYKNKKNVFDIIALIINTLGLILNQSRGPIIYLMIVIILDRYNKYKELKNIKLDYWKIIKNITYSFVIGIVVFLLIDSVYKYVSNIEINGKYIFNFEIYKGRILSTFDKNTFDRINTWKLVEEFKIINIFIGLGPGYFKDKYIIESQYISILFENGIIILLLYIIFNYNIIKKFKEKKSYCETNNKYKSIYLYLIMESLNIIILMSVVTNFFYFFTIKKIINTNSRLK